MALCFLGSASAQNQTADAYFKPPVKFSIGNHVAGTGNKLFYATNLSFSTGTEFYYNQNKKHRIGQTLNLGYSNNDVLGDQIRLRSNFFYRYTNKTGIFADLGLGLGFLRQFHPREIYEFDAQTGTYNPVKDPGTTSTFAGYDLSLGYNFMEKQIFPASVFIKLRNYVQVPYLGTEDFPIMLHTITELGISFKIRKNEK